MKTLCMYRFVQRAYDLWNELEVRAGRKLYINTGGLMLGTPDSSVIRGARASATKYELAHELLSAKEIRRIYPAFHLPRLDASEYANLAQVSCFPRRVSDLVLDPGGIPKRNIRVR